MNKFLYLLFVVTFFFSCSENSSSSTPKEVTNTEEKSQNIAEEKVEKTGRIVCFGNSLTAGYGLDPNDAWPQLLQNRIDSLDYNYEVVNAGVSGETTSGGLGRIDWMLKQGVDIFILELGANDGLRGLDLAESKKNLTTIIEKVKATYPDATIILAGMKLPPNLGEEYEATFEKMFVDLAKEENVKLISFFLKNVAGRPELNLEDGIHPNEQGQKLVANNVWEVLKEEL